MACGLLAYITLKDAQAELAKYLREQAYVCLPEDSEPLLKEAVQRAQRYMHDTHPESRTAHVEDVELTTGDVEVDIPYDIDGEAVAFVSVVSEEGYAYELTEGITDIDRDSYDVDESCCMPTYYSVSGRQVQMCPAVDAERYPYLRVCGAVRVTKAINPSDKIFIDEKALVLQAAVFVKKALAKRSDSEKIRLARQLKYLAQARDEGDD